MRPTMTEIAEAFSRHRFEEAFPFLLDDADWAILASSTYAGSLRS
jgi:hypothetical protein